jgi:hypothetical protein
MTFSFHGRITLAHIKIITRFFHISAHIRITHFAFTNFDELSGILMPSGKKDVHCDRKETAIGLEIAIKKSSN